jgi:hypothetical protein
MDKGVNMKGEFFSCNCGHHAISVTIDKPLVYIALWCIGFTGIKYSLWEKIKMCYYIFKKGHPYDDAIVLNKDDTNKLINLLNKING